MLPQRSHQEYEAEHAPIEWKGKKCCRPRKHVTVAEQVQSLIGWYGVGSSQLAQSP